MPVPAFRNSRSRVRRRRSHHALKPIRVTVDKETGEMVLPHHEMQNTEVIKTVAKKEKTAEAPKQAPDADHDHSDHDHKGHTHA